MKILILLFISFTCLAQERYIKENEIPSVHIPKLGATYDTMRNGQGVAFRFITTAYGTVDTTKMIIIKYEAYQIDVANSEPPPAAQIDTIDSEQLVYEGWARHGATSTPGWYKGTISYSSAGEARYTFVGTGVEVWGETGNHGTGTVTVDGQSKSASWQSDTRKLPAKVAEFKGLPQGQHTVTIKPVSGTILLDFLIIQR